LLEKTKAFTSLIFKNPHLFSYVVHLGGAFGTPLARQ
jgi:hypothetical protein